MAEPQPLNTAAVVNIQQKRLYQWKAIKLTFSCWTLAYLYIRTALGLFKYGRVEGSDHNF